MRKVMSIILALLLTLLTFGSIGLYADQSSVHSVEIIASDCSVGDEVEVEVVLPAGADAAGVNFNFVYDNTLFQLVKAEKGALLSAHSGIINEKYAPNMVRVTFGESYNYLSVGGTLVVFTFNALKAGEATFAVESLRLADELSGYLETRDTEISIDVASEVFSPIISVDNGVVGETVDAEIYIPDVAGVTAVSFDLQYDPEIMTIADAYSSFGDTLYSINTDYSSNAIRFTSAGLDNISSDVPVLVVSFELIIPGTADVCTKNFRLANVYGGSFDTSNSSVQVEVEENVHIPVTKITLNTTSLTLGIGNKYELVATYEPQNATNVELLWSSSKASVASVSNGTITAKAKGVAVITVKTADGSAEATCSVRVLTSLDYILGDSSGDGILNRLDLLMISQLINGKSIEIDEVAADINKDGLVDSNDEELISKYFAGTIETLS